MLFRFTPVHDTRKKRVCVSGFGAGSCMASLVAVPHAHGDIVLLLAARPQLPAAMKSTLATHFWKTNIFPLPMHTHKAITKSVY